MFLSSVGISNVTGPSKWFSAVNATLGSLSARCNCTFCSAMRVPISAFWSAMLFCTAVCCHSLSLSPGCRLTVKLSSVSIWIVVSIPNVVVSWWLIILCASFMRVRPKSRFSRCSSYRVMSFSKAIPCSMRCRVWLISVSVSAMLRLKTVSWLRRLCSCRYCPVRRNLTRWRFSSASTSVISLLSRAIRMPLVIAPPLYMVCRAINARLLPKCGVLAVNLFFSVRSQICTLPR